MIWNVCNVIIINLFKSQLKIYLFNNALSFLQQTVSVGCICGTVLLGLGLGLSY